MQVYCLETAIHLAVDVMNLTINQENTNTTFSLKRDRDHTLPFLRSKPEPRPVAVVSIDGPPRWFGAPFEGRLRGGEGAPKLL